MKIKIELTEEELKELIFNELERSLVGITFNKSKVQILVKSKQNFKSEWEAANFKAVYET